MILPAGALHHLWAGEESVVELYAATRSPRFDETSQGGLRGPAFGGC